MTTRTEAFSDAVMAIAVTLLVLDLRPPDSGRFAEELLEHWPAYLAYVTAFLTVGSIWLNHHALFSRVETTDSLVSLLNLGLLLGTSLVPWPTSLISASSRLGDRSDQVAAVTVYAVITILVGLPWSRLNAHLARRPQLLFDPASAGGFDATPVSRRCGLSSPSARSVWP